jgi:hypothetical protein
MFGAFCLGPRVDWCESVRGPGIPRSYRAVRITARGYGLVKCAGQRWWNTSQTAIRPSFASGSDIVALITAQVK